ncbi:GNAT family N-acetyltransferase [Anaerobacillus sp. CMMVII]|uniref:GNAT family N-acetyltransferase n=1 Tax=Anaerobacillus sp. CMMVII TaxID=2755588 RepID=UPI0021B74061|nr:GNAT family N-acetyltransferase [Anaerobacillus sp. CMMVII]MCT8138424.1 GNAT family N-acetyltransferase [Anaerobacillus sp. CMMVII]
MAVTKRFYNRQNDYEKVFELLIQTYQPGGKFSNWHPSRWEYMHFHTYYQDKLTGKSGVWEENGKIVAIVHNELGDGMAYFTVYPEYSYLKPAMLKHAEEYLAKIDNGKKMLRVYGNDFDVELNQLFQSHGYGRQEVNLQHHTICFFNMENPFPAITLPEGYKIVSLEDNNDLIQVDRVQWRGFNHEGEPPEDGVEARKLMQSAPNFRKDLTIVTQASDGRFASYVGMWLCLEKKVGYVEPVCTDPDFRKLGLGKAALLESVRRCIEQGAEEVIVESSLPIYLSAGFIPKFVRYAWDKEF